MRALPRLTIASPCEQAWSEMEGNDRARVCPACTRLVYNVASLNRREIDRLISTYEGKPPCLRIFRRPDGTLVTKGCLASVGRAAHAAWLRACAVAAVALAFWSAAALSFRAWFVPAPPAPAAVAPADTEARQRAAEAEAQRALQRDAIARHRNKSLATAGLPRLAERPIRPEPTGSAASLTKSEVVRALQPLKDVASTIPFETTGRHLIPMEIVFRRNGNVRARVTGPLAGTANARRIETAAARIHVRRSDGLKTAWFIDTE